MNPMGENDSVPLRLHFDRSVRLAFRGSAISSDGGLLLYRELDDALGLTDLAAGSLVDARTGRNGRPGFAGLLRQSIYSRLAGYEDVNDADRLCRDRSSASSSGAVRSSMGPRPRPPSGGSRPRC